MIDYKKLIELSKDYNIDDIEIVEYSSEELDLNYYQGKVEKNTASSITSITVKGIVNGHKSVYDIDDMDLTEEEILKRLYNAGSVINSKEIESIFEGSKSYPEVDQTAGNYREYPISEKIQMLADAEKLIFSLDKRIVNVPTLEYSEECNAKKIINSKGMNVSKRNEYCAFVAYAIAAEGDETRNAFEVDVKKNYNELDYKKTVETCVKNAVSMFGAKPIESGEYPVIIENKAMRSLLAVFQSFFSGEAALNKLTPLIGKENTKIFSEKISILDLPLQEDAIIREPFDDEGVACYNKPVVENGVFKGFLHNLKTAKAFGTTTTGNGFGSSVRGMNLQIKPGNVSKEEMIASIEKGIILTAFDGLHAGANVITGDMSLKTEGFYIENGKIVKPITLIVMTGNFIKMLNENVECVGSDLINDYQSVKAPSIKFNSLSISGN